MHGVRAAIFSVLAGLAAAAGPEEVTTAPGIISSGNTHYNKVLLAPVVHPEVDTSDLAHLRPKNSALLHYDNNPDPLANSDVATVNISASEVPVVQLENTAHVKSVVCTNDTATIVFSAKDAYRTAVESWSNQTNLVMVSFSPTCGNAHADQKREFILVSSISPDPRTMTINASMKLATVFDAFGTSTVFSAEVGRYNAPQQGPSAKSPDLLDTQIFKWDEYPVDGVKHGEWGSGFNIFNDSDFSVACIGCGTKGSVAITGNFLWTWYGVTTAQMNVNGSMEAVAKIGIISNGMHATVPVSPIELVNVPLGAIQVPGFITLGPALSIHARGKFDVSASGSLLVGARLSWPKIAGLGNLASRVAQATGYFPKIEPVHELIGTVAAEFQAHLPVSIGLTVDLVEGWWVKSTQMTDTPGLDIKGEISELKSCRGWEHTGTLVNQMEMDIIGGITPFPSWNGSLYQICQPMPGSNTTTLASSAISPSTLSTVIASSASSSSISIVTSTPSPAPKKRGNAHKKMIPRKEVLQQPRKHRALPSPTPAPYSTSSTSTSSCETSTSSTATSTSEPPCTTTPTIRMN